MRTISKDPATRDKAVLIIVLIIVVFVLVVGALSIYLNHVAISQSPLYQARIVSVHNYLGSDTTQYQNLTLYVNGQYHWVVLTCNYYTVNDTLSVQDESGVFVPVGIGLENPNVGGVNSAYSPIGYFIVGSVAVGCN